MHTGIKGIKACEKLSALTSGFMKHANSTDKIVLFPY